MGYAIAEAALDAKHEVMLDLRPGRARAAAEARTGLDHDRRRAVSTRSMSTLPRLRRARDVRGSLPITNRVKLRAQKMPKAARRTSSLALDSDARHSRVAADESPHIISWSVSPRRRTTSKTNAQKKLRDKNCDLIVANDVSGSDIGMESDENEVRFFRQTAKRKRFRALQKKCDRARN